MMMMKKTVQIALGMGHVRKIAQFVHVKVGILGTIVLLKKTWQMIWKKVFKGLQMLF